MVFYSIYEHSTDPPPSFATYNLFILFTSSASSYYYYFGSETDFVTARSTGDGGVRVCYDANSYAYYV
jgi:hypothetical protein